MDKQDVRLHLIETGAKAFMAKGYHAVGLKEILAYARVPKGSFYYYFRSKEDFCIAIIDHYIRLYAESTSPSSRTVPGRPRTACSPSSPRKRTITAKSSASTAACSPNWPSNWPSSANPSAPSSIAA
jgi:hypothetical protein